MRVVEQEPSPATFALVPGLAWFAGTQDRDNSIANAPPAPYLCSIRAEVVSLARHAARIGTMDRSGSPTHVVYFVDTDTKYLYAQPHPGTDAARERNWGITDPNALLPFDPARDLARWIFKVSREKAEDFEAWWASYISRPALGRPPVPLCLPSRPAEAYRDARWVGVQGLAREANEGQPGWRT